MPQFSVHTIRSYFQQFGSIKKTKLVTDRNGHSKGYGFIEFINESHAQSVLLEKFHWIQGKQINIGPVKEKVAFRQQINQALNLSTKQQDVHISGGKLQESTFIHLQKRKINRSRSYNKSISKSSLRSLDSTANLLVISSEEELKETKEEIEAYQNKVDKQLTKIQEEEQKEKTLTKRRVERRARWARRK